MAEVVDAAFAEHPTMRNAVRRLGLDLAAAEAVLGAAGIDPSAQPEELDATTFVRLTEALAGTIDARRPDDAPPDTVEVEARAKVNLALAVLGAEADGYHRIDTVLVPLDLADSLVIHAAGDPSFRTLSLSLDVEGEPSFVAGVPIDQSNLALRAAAALAEAVEYEASPT